LEGIGTDLEGGAKNEKALLSLCGCGFAPSREGKTNETETRESGTWDDGVMWPFPVEV